MTKYSYIPKSMGFKYFTLRGDFCAITGNAISAATLCVAEIKTNEIIDRLEALGIVENTLPPEEYLWFPLATREVASMTLGMYGKSAYAHTLALKGNDTIPSLVEMGFLHSRDVARPYGKVPHPKTKIHRDAWGGEYIIVDDNEGHYEGTDGLTHCAKKMGYPRISRQFLLLIDRVNKAIAMLDDASQ